MINKPLHSFHIPVMGLAYTIDSPIRVAQFGISSVISIIDDEIVEKMKNFYNQKFNLNYQEISTKIEDYRAKRITDYLNLVDEIVTQKFETFKEEISKNSESLKHFMELLPNTSEIKNGLQNFITQSGSINSNIKKFIDKNLFPGNIDVNIMTKVDKDNFKNNEQLPVIYNDAHASLRGYAQSNLSSSVVLSAGMNPRLYSYIEEFDDFYPDAENQIKKKITLKVSDFRSAMIQGNFLAKKGIWVSEYRIESGLNCGGHAFATDGLLLGPILDEFNSKKQELVSSSHSLMVKALEQKGRIVPSEFLETKITVQGGVGTSEEHSFLLNHYKVDSVGWGSPFLLVPEATSVDDETRVLLKRSQPEDYFLSNISPLGVPFNTLKGSSNEIIRRKRAEQGRIGSSCPKKLLALSKEYSQEGICTASKKYADLKIAEIEERAHILTALQKQGEVKAIQEKACLCVGLVNSAYIENNIEIKGEKQGVVICPGPNLAYFDKEVSLAEMVKHIYGNADILSYNERPVFFVSELTMYVEHLEKELSLSAGGSNAMMKKWGLFKNNLLSGILYYQNLLESTHFFMTKKQDICNELRNYAERVANIQIDILPSKA